MFNDGPAFPYNTYTDIHIRAEEEVLLPKLPAQEQITRTEPSIFHLDLKPLVAASRQVLFEYGGNNVRKKGKLV